MSHKEEVSMKDKMSTSLSCFLVGVGTGMALTLLFAPMNGAETRGLLRRKVRAGEKWVEETAAAAEQSAVRHAGDLRERVQEVAEVITRS
jgi:gas vesicle protein